MEETSRGGTTDPAMLPGLADVVPLTLDSLTLDSSTLNLPSRDPKTTPGSSDPLDPIAVLHDLLRRLDDRDGTAPASLDSAVTTLESVRRLESWLCAARHRAALQAQRAARADHERWIAAHPAAVEDPSFAVGTGLTRRQRLAVGERSGVAETACALRISEQAAHRLLSRAERFTELLPSTLASLESGSITSQAATLVADVTAEYADALPDCVDPGAVERLVDAIEFTETSLLGAAERGRTDAQLRRRASVLRERCHPQTFSQRHAQAHAEGFVSISPDRDGMARLTASLPAAAAWRIDARLSALARRLREDHAPTDTARDDGHPETVTQLRSDVLVDLLTCGVLAAASPSGPGNDLSAPTDDRSRPDTMTLPSPDRRGRVTASDLSAGPRSGPVRSGWGRVEDTAVPTVLLTLPAETLLGGDGPGWLGRFGAIPAADARDLASRASSVMLGVHVDVSTSLPAVGTRRDSLAGRGAPPEPSSTHPPLPPPPVLESPAAEPPAAEPARAPSPPAPAPPTMVDAVVVPVMVTTGRQYRVPAALRRSLMVRDGTCRFPGCGRSAERCDVDHVQAWADGGTTIPENLAHLCRKHHVLKHHSGWSVDGGHADTSTADTSTAATVMAGTATAGTAQAEPVRLRWTSPAGRVYVTDPEPAPF